MLPITTNRLSAACRVLPALAATMLLAAAGPVVACTSDAECDDAVVCNGVETCDTGTMACVPGTPPPDGDGDGTCDPADNCPAVANPTQADLDDDGAGDACDDADADLNLTKLVLRRNTAGQGDKSAFKGKAFFLTAPPADVFNGLAGFTIRVQDSLGLDRSSTFQSTDCVGVADRVKCKTADRAMKASIKPVRATPEVVRIDFVLKKLMLLGPFFGPVTVTLTETGTTVDRSGVIIDCIVKLTGLSCRQF